MFTVQTVRIYPTRQQAETLSAWMRTAAKVWNHFLEHRIKIWARRKERTSHYSQTASLTRWRRNDSQIASPPWDTMGEVIGRLHGAFDSFFRRAKLGENPGFPRFKQSHRWSSICFRVGRQPATGAKVEIPKLGGIKARGLRPLEGKLKSIRVICRSSGWYARLLTDDGKEPPPKREVETIVGVDVGLESFATLSTGEQIPNPRHGRRRARQLKRAQQKLSRRQKRSRRREKQRLVVARIHEKIGESRKDFAHKLSRRLVSESDLVAVEKLGISGLARAKLSKSVHDAAWGIFLRQLKCKAEKAGATVVEVDPRGTSQECSGCGRTERKPLSQRWHSCPCGVSLHRDHNAARNILARAMGASVMHVEQPPAGRRRKTPVAVLR